MLTSICRPSHLAQPLIRIDTYTNEVRMAYIDSELAKRRQGHESSTFNDGGGKRNLSANGALINAGLHRQPATLGKLHEIDLGPDATLKNIARTEAAKRRLEGGEMEIEEGESGKVRRRDGKPWRGRRRRNSEDVKRDKIVEEVMRESRRKPSLGSSVRLSPNSC